MAAEQVCAKALDVWSSDLQLQSEQLRRRLRGEERLGDVGGGR
jgi:hypothetical protein